MCGRYAITSAPEAVRALFRYREAERFPPRYNIAPTQPIPVVRGVEGGERSFVLMRWGLIPSWVKDPQAFSLLINARGESVNDKPAFRNAMKRRRCLIPADGFYEWKEGGGRKRSFFVRKAGGGPLAFAGLWETWTGPDGEEMDTVCIVTTAANRQLAPLHDRMPAIIAPEAFDMWLDCDRVDALTAAALLAPAPGNLLEAYEVSLAVNRAANDFPALVEPLAAGQGARAGARPDIPRIGKDAAAVPAGSQAQTAPGASKPGVAKPSPKKDSGQASLF
jgi:putative SOS response-associated peptidase YedK